MSKYGKYDPVNTAHGSSLFSYGEVPLTSNKLNTWNGNIEAALNWTIQSLAVLVGAGETDFILGEGASDRKSVV